MEGHVVEETDSFSSTKLKWKGFTTTFHDLQKEGWEITIKPKYDNWRLPGCVASSREKIYIRHPENRMIGRIIKKTITDYTIGTDSVVTYDKYELDYLIQEHNQRKSAPKLFEERDLTENDIPGLLELILKLQPKLKRKKKPNDDIIKQAEILFLKQA